MTESFFRDVAGRGSLVNPGNRFERIHLEDDWEQIAEDDELLGDGGRKVATEYYADDSQTIVSENNSPDIHFRYSVNPYRGCVHGCSYCYARPYHEYLGYSAGLDFETKILVKHNAPTLLREFLARDDWSPELIAFSGVTDCYQPAERKFELTRQCLAVTLEARQPIGVITKNALITRDVDMLAEMAEMRLVKASISITTLDRELAHQMEPRTSTPSARLRAITALADAGVPVKVLTAPIIPGLNDSEIPTILQAAKDAGAQSAGYTLLRLPLTVEPVFMEWLERVLPDESQKIMGRVRQTRQGRTNTSEFGKRMKGTGVIAEQIQSMFQVFRKKAGLESKLPDLNYDLFQPPTSTDGQMRLF